MQSNSQSLKQNISNSKFSVVEFKSERNVCAVPTGWIEHQGGLQYCAWPSGTKLMNLIKDPTSKPQKTWKRLEIRVFPQFANSKCLIYGLGVDVIPIF